MNHINSSIFIFFRIQDEIINLFFKCLDIFGRNASPLLEFIDFIDDKISSFESKLFDDKFNVVNVSFVARVLKSLLTPVEPIRLFDKSNEIKFQPRAKAEAITKHDGVEIEHEFRFRYIKLDMRVIPSIKNVPCGN